MPATLRRCAPMTSPSWFEKRGTQWFANRRGKPDGVQKCCHLHIECETLPIHIDDDLQLKRSAPKHFSSAVMDVTLESGALEFLAP